MKEIKDILQAYDRSRQEGWRSALATVVHVEGSSYRRPGARMLVTENGQLTGAISGGCLEGDALRKAMLAIHQQQNKLVTYDTLHEDDHSMGVQLGCNGIVHILFEPIDPDRGCNPMRLLQELTGERKEAVLVTLFSMDRSAEQPGTSLLYKGGEVMTSLEGELRATVLKDAGSAFRAKSSRVIGYRSADCDLPAGSGLQGFVEFIAPPPALVIAGAGNDVLPLVKLTSMLGWHTTVIDGRAHYVHRACWAGVDRLLVAKASEALPQLETDAQTIYVLMTHNYQYDLTLLKELVRRDVVYIGVLGPKKKLERMLGELEEEGIVLNEKQRAVLHGPVGLDIGAETAEEIALSIVAEIKAMLSGRSGMALKEKKEAIHG